MGITLIKQQLDWNELNSYFFLSSLGPQYFGLIPGWANPTGVALLVILVVMVVCSMKWVRKGGYFEVSLMAYSEFGY